MLYPTEQLSQITFKNFGHKKPVMKRASCDLAGTRTQDPYIKSVLLYQLSYQILKSIKRNKDHQSDPYLVIRLGLEPRTHTLKVYCSTN